MRFHGYFRSSAAYRCRIALNLKGIDHEFVPVSLLGGDQRSESYLALNPQGLVPALEVDGQVFTQSLAIIEWLDEYQPEPALLPADRDLRARARAFAGVIACDIHPLQNLRVLNFLRNDIAQPESVVEAWLQRWLGDGLAACEALLAREPRRGDFAFGDTPGLADICLVPQLFSADRFKVSLDGMPRLRDVAEACEALPAFARAHPSKQPDHAG
ncbi:MAG: maleylacetoacetate isomerase [Gammaproteobacteria bacterium]|nr:MAG: maleylacetoacetate isomerase [Gammaproteobacteria bacterium]